MSLIFIVMMRLNLIGWNVSFNKYLLLRFMHVYILCLNLRKKDEIKVWFWFLYFDVSFWSKYENLVESFVWKFVSKRWISLVDFLIWEWFFIWTKVENLWSTLRKLQWMTILAIITKDIATFFKNWKYSKTISDRLVSLIDFI